MLPSFLTAVFFSISVICAGRSAKLIGASEANFWRLALATFFLSLWAYSFGKGLSGESFALFFLSGVIGIGVGDVALFQTLPRLGSRLTLLLTQCLTAPFGALIEWQWLGTKLAPMQILCSLIILAGIGISLAPGRHLNLTKSQIIPGVLFALVSALGQACGGVLSRKAFAVADANNDSIDGATAAFQRLVGGLLVAGVCLLVVKWPAINSNFACANDNSVMSPREKWRRAWPWVLANSLTGQTIGATCFLWAFHVAPAGIVLSIVATAPLIAIPFAWIVDGERPSLHSVIGGVIAVAGVIGLARLK